MSGDHSNASEEGPPADHLLKAVGGGFVDASTQLLPQGQPNVPEHPPSTCYEHFEVLRREDGSLWHLGSGAMGETYKALDTRLRCPVALKIIRPGVPEQDMSARARFLREARTAASVHHPNIARVFHLGELADGHAFYAMEFIHGETLQERVHRHGTLSILLALEITLQIARALVSAAEADLVHRDLKPANLMLTVAGLTACETWTDATRCVATSIEGPASDPPLVKVIDFGLARTMKRGANGPLTVQGDFVGTPLYASPEQFGHDTEVIDSRSDIFSLGCTLWFMLMGQSPFSGRSLEEIQRLKERTLSVKALRATAVPESVIELLGRMLAPD